MSLLLKALKQAEQGPVKAAMTDADLDLEPMETPFSVRREWVQPHDNDTESIMQPKRPDARIYWPLGLVPTTAFLALLIALGYGIYVYLAISQPARLAPLNVRPQLIATTSPSALPTQPVLPSANAPKALAKMPTGEGGKSPPSLPRTPSHHSTATASVARHTSPAVGKAVSAPVTTQLIPSIQQNDAQADLEAAYRAYQAGKLEEAKSQYNKISDRDKNADALLGLAAIAIVQGHQVEGVRLYQQVISLDPRNAVAQAALLDTLGTSDATAAESRLKNQMQQAPSAYLYYALGNLYADQKRWSDGESAYYEAYKRDPANADYAFNLAISLDHLHQNEAAIRHYEAAIRLAGPDSQFNRSQAEARIQQLKGHGNF
ncbi:MAG: tetratricopeptide repeat protein [Thiobacillaceae bacterium]